MRIAADKTSTSARGTSSRTPSSAPAIAPPIAQSAAIPQAQPPADLLALQRVIASRPASPVAALPVAATPQVQREAAAPVAAPVTAPQATVGAMEAELDAIVVQTHARHLTAITKALSGLTITDGDVDIVLRILQTVDGPVIHALMRAIPAKRLAEYVDNLNSPHAKRFRREVLESLRVA